MTGVELSPPVTFRLRAGSGPVFLSGQECYGKLYHRHLSPQEILDVSTDPPKANGCQQPGLEAVARAVTTALPLPFHVLWGPQALAVP